MIYLILAIAYFLFCRGYDTYTSSKFAWHGQMEGNKNFQNKYGYPDLLKENLFWIGLVVITVVGRALFYDPAQGVLQDVIGALIIVGIGSLNLNAALTNKRHAGQRRLTQIAFFIAIKNALVVDDKAARDAVYAGVEFKGPIGGRSFYWLVGWIWTEELEREAAMKECQIKINTWTLAHVYLDTDPDTWFEK